MVAALLLLAIGMFASLLAADAGSPATLAVWTVGALLLIKLPLLGVVWWIISRRRDEPWAALVEGCGEILALPRAARPRRAVERDDAPARLAYFAREAWFVADSAKDADKAEAVAVAVRIDAMANRAGAPGRRVVSGEPSRSFREGRRGARAPRHGRGGHSRNAPGTSYAPGAMSTALTSGSIVAGFRISRLIGKGAAGTVYLAEDADGRQVALKVPIPELARDERFRQRFLREAQIAAALDEPHVVPTVAFGEADGMLYLAMFYVDGLDLREILRREGPLAPERAVTYRAGRRRPRRRARAAGSSTAT